MLRLIVGGLAVMACTKIVSYAYFYREATQDIIIATYRQVAIDACARNSAGGPLRVPPQAWQNPTEISLLIGKREIDVYLWQVNHRLCNARYKHPYLIVTADAETAHIYCEYDVVRGFASVQQL